MVENAAGIPRSGKTLIGLLTVANIGMLIVGALTIPPNLGRAAPRVNMPAGTVESRSLATAGPELGAASGEPRTPAVQGAQSTDERPDLEDFLWYTEDVLYDGVPADAVAIDDLGAVAGGWKALIIYDPDGTHDASAIELLNIELAGTADDLSLILDWYLIVWPGDGSVHDETEMEDTEFRGHWESGSVWASGVGTIRLTDIYAVSGRQHAVGLLDTPDGIPAYLALVRP